jgi:hypothetical protein
MQKVVLLLASVVVAMTVLVLARGFLLLGGRILREEAFLCWRGGYGSPASLRCRLMMKDGLIERVLWVCLPLLDIVLLLVAVAMAMSMAMRFGLLYLKRRRERIDGIPAVFDEALLHFQILVEVLSEVRRHLRGWS